MSAMLVGGSAPDRSGKSILNSVAVANRVLLATEVADHQGGIHSDVRGDNAQRGALEPFRRESTARGGQDVGPRLSGIARAGLWHPETVYVTRC